MTVALKPLWNRKWHSDKVVPSAAAGLKIQSACSLRKWVIGEDKERGNADEKSVGSDVHINEQMGVSFFFSELKHQL